MTTSTEGLDSLSGDTLLAFMRAADVHHTATLTITNAQPYGSPDYGELVVSVERGTSWLWRARLRRGSHEWKAWAFEGETPLQALDAALQWSGGLFSELQEGKEP